MENVVKEIKLSNDVDLNSVAAAMIENLESSECNQCHSNCNDCGWDR